MRFAKILLFGLLALSQPIVAQQIIYNPLIQAIDANGNPMLGAKLYVDDAGTSNDRTTYSDAALTTPNANPLVADGSGRFGPIFVAASATNIKLTLHTSADAEVWTLDNVPASLVDQYTIGLNLWPVSAEETAAGLTASDLSIYYNYGNALRYKADPTGASDSSVELQYCIDLAWDNATTGYCYIPAGTYEVDTKLTVTTSGSSDTERIRIYGDGATSIINSTVVGDTTLEIIDGQLFTIEKLRFTGNDLTGASGNGHAIALRDATPNSGTFTPLEPRLHDLSFNGFRGQDTEITNTTTGVSTTAASIYIGPGLAVDINKVEIGNTGIGILADETQNSHLHRIIVDSADEFCIELDAVGDGFSVSDSDLINCGLDGNGDPSVFSGALNYAGIGVKSAVNNVTIYNNKFKGGQALMIFASLNVAIRDNYMRVDPGTVVTDTWAIQADTFTKLVIDNNDFEYLVSGGNTNNRNAMDLDMNASYPAAVTISNNNFNHANDVDYDIRIRGASDANSNIAVNIFGNSFGNANNGRTTSDVDDVILLDDGNFHGSIHGNLFITKGDGVSAGGSITDTLDIAGASAANNSMHIFGNISRAYLTGATITNPIEDFQEGSFTGTLTGCMTSPTGSIEFSVEGDIVTLEIPAITGTSNTTAATITGMPSYIQPTANQQVHAVNQDNSGEVLGRVHISSAGVITLHNGLTSVFTSSGTKGISAQTITYRRK